MRPEPATAITAAASAVDAAITLADACTQPGTPMAGHVETLKALREATRIVADLLPIEARLAARALTPPEPVTATRRLGTAPEPEEAAAARSRIGSAAYSTGLAADNLHTAWKDAVRAVRAAAGENGAEPDGDGGRALRLARQAMRALAELEDALADAERLRAAPTPAMLAGHRSIVQALLITAGRLAVACDNLRDPVREAAAELGPAVRRRQNVAGGLFHAGSSLRRADGHLRKADNTLTEAWGRARRDARKAAVA